MRVQFDLMFSGKEYKIDSDAMLLSQFSAIEAATGLVFTALFSGLANSQPRAIRALAWLLGGCAEDYGAIDFPMSEWKVSNIVVDGDDAPKEQPPTPREPDGSDHLPDTSE